MGYDCDACLTTFRNNFELEESCPVMHDPSRNVDGLIPADCGPCCRETLDNYCELFVMTETLLLSVTVEGVDESNKDATCAVFADALQAAVASCTIDASTRRNLQDAVTLNINLVVSDASEAE